MQPGKGLNGRDSFSTYQPADIFVHIRYPQMKALRPAIPPSDFDTLENEAVKKELEMLKLLMKNQKNKPFYILIRSGKIIFAGLFLPAHFFFFIVPKWLMRNIFPKLAILRKNTVNTCKNSFNRIVKEIVAKLQVILKLVEVLKPLHSLIKSGFNKLINNFLTPFQKMVQFGDAVIKRTSNFISQKITLAASIIKSIKQRFVSVANLSIKSESLPSSEFFLKTVLVNTLSKTKEMYKTTSKKLSNTVKVLQNILNAQVERASKAVNTFKKLASKTLKPVMDIAKVVSKRISEGLNVAKKRIANAIAPKVQAIENNIEKVSQLIKPPLTFAIAMITQINQNVVNAFFNNPRFQIFKAQVTKLKKITAKVQRIQAAILKSYERFKKHLIQGVKKLSRQGKKIFAKVQSKAKSFRKKIATFVQKLSGALKSLKDVFVKVLRKILRFFVLTLRWCRIMIKFSGYLVREIFRELQS
jgi:phage-related protein